MGQKVNPIGFRVGVVRGWDAQWFSEKDYQRFLHEDIAIRKFIKAKYYSAGVSKVTIERAANKAKVDECLAAAKTNKDALTNAAELVQERLKRIEANRAQIQDNQQMVARMLADS